MLERQGHPVATAENGEVALARMAERPYGLVLLDLKMPGLDGMDLLRRIKEKSPDTEVIVMTAYGSVETAVEAMKTGAYDYLSKPIDKERFPILIEKCLERQRLVSENRLLREHLTVKSRFEQMIGQSLPMKRIYEMVDLVAGSNVTILLIGESGTGKELVSRAIHQRSPRSRGPFITINCGALPESLYESEMFGYDKGAFTGAAATKLGRFELADGGTLFLDEIGELNLKNQVDFLRVLETREFRRLGGTKLVKVDLRVIAATNRNLQKAVEDGEFREDLYYRLNVIPISIPPLRDRKEDIPILMETFLKEFTELHRRKIKEVSPDAIKRLIHYSWPGNVRELKNVIERLVVTIQGNLIAVEDLPSEIQTGRAEEKTMAIPLGLTLKEIEERVIQRTLNEMTPHREKAAKLLGISPRALQYKIKSYKIKE
jgi:DNA-binding NtrC family response regulator